MSRHNTVRLRRLSLYVLIKHERILQTLYQMYFVNLFFLWDLRGLRPILISQQLFLISYVFVDNPIWTFVTAVIK